MSKETRDKASAALWGTPTVGAECFAVVDALTAHILDEVESLLIQREGRHWSGGNAPVSPVGSTCKPELQVPPPDGERMSDEEFGRLGSTPTGNWGGWDKNAVWIEADRARKSEAQKADRIAELERENAGLVIALDALAIALTNHGHQWTDTERYAYETATGGTLQEREGLINTNLNNQDFLDRVVRERDNAEKRIADFERGMAELVDERDERDRRIVELEREVNLRRGESQERMGIIDEQADRIAELERKLAALRGLLGEWISRERFPGLIPGDLVDRTRAALAEEGEQP